MIEKIISYRSLFYYFFFSVPPNSYGRMSDDRRGIQVFLEEFSFNHDPVPAGQQEIGIHVFIHNLTHFLFTDVKVFGGFPERQHVLLPVGNFYHMLRL